MRRNLNSKKFKQRKTLMKQKGVTFDSNTKPSAAIGSRTQGRQIAQREDDYEDDFEQLPSAKKGNQKSSTTPVQQATVKAKLPQSQANVESENNKKVVNLEEVQAGNQTNRYIIYKFMKKGFSALSAEDLACTMVSPDFTIDFRKNTGEEWASSYQFKVIERLDNCKYNLKWVTKKSMSGGGGLDPFFAMVKEGDISRVVEFMRQTSIPQDEILDAVEPQSKKSPLHIAAGEGHLQMVEFLLHKGSRVDARDKLLRTPLHLACQAGHAMVVKILLDNNADPQEKDNSGRTAMHYACCSTCVEQLTLLTQHGSDLVHLKDHAGRTPLHYTIFNSMPRQLEMAIKLLNLGADVNAFDLDRRTALHHAAESGKARMIPLLVQRGATTGTKDTLKGLTPIELAATDHIKELIIVHSTPTYQPKQDDLSRGLVVDGLQMKIQRETVSSIDSMVIQNKVKAPAINKKPRNAQVVEDSKVQESSRQYHQQEPLEDIRYGDGIGPAKAWEKVKESYLPYNIRNYQDRLVAYLKRVQEFGVQSYQHAKKPYLFTGSWMEYVRSLDDLMLQINGAKSNEAVMKVFNILFPYDKPLPQGRGDELSLQGFYNTAASAFKEPIDEDCDPEKLKDKLEKEAEEDKHRVLENNQVEDIQDLLDLKRQLMTLEQVNGMHLLTIQEKDSKIRDLQSQLASRAASAEDGTQPSEDQYLTLMRENTELKIQVGQLAEQLEISANRLEDLTRLMQGEQDRKLSEASALRSSSKVQELEEAVATLEKRLGQEKERNRALRFKAGQVFLSSLEKGTALITTSRGGPKIVDGSGDYFLADDDALMRLMLRLEQVGDPGLQQRLREAGDPATDSITKAQFVTFLQRLGLLPTDILALQRIVGFCDGISEKLKISEIMLRVMERAEKRKMVEVDTLKTLAAEFKTKGYSLQDAFAHLDTNQSGFVSLEELEDAFKAMKLQVGTQTIKNILNLFDTSKDNQISLGEFEKQLGPFLGSAATGRVQALTVDKIQSKVISEDMKKELVAEMRQEQKKKVQYEDFSLKPAVDAKQVRQKELLIVQALRAGSDLTQEIICGEIKLQFEESINLMEIPGKPVPFIAINVPNLSAEGRSVQTLNTKPASGFGLTRNFSTAVRLPFINRDKVKLGDALQIDFFFQPSSGDNAQANLASAEFAGECNFAWKDLLKSDQWSNATYELTDEQGRCGSGRPVQGQVKIFARWIPAGHADSKYDAQGNKKDAAPEQSKVPQKREQLSGSVGKLEVYPLTYVHPYLLDSKERFCVEMTLGTQVNQSVPKPLIEDGNPTNSTVSLKDIRTLPVNDLKTDKSLTLRILTSKGVEIARSEIRTLQPFYISPGAMIQLKNQKFDVTQGSSSSSQPLDETKKGLLNIQIRFQPAVAAESGLPVAVEESKGTQEQKPPIMKQTTSEVLEQPVVTKKPTVVEDEDFQPVKSSKLHQKEEQPKPAFDIPADEDIDQPVTDQQQEEEEAADIGETEEVVIGGAMEADEPVPDDFE